MYPTTSVTCCNLLSFHCFWYRPTLELFATCPLHSLMLGIGPCVYEICQWFSLANLNMGVFFCMQHVGLNFHVAYDGALQFLRCLRSHGLCKIKLSYFGPSVIHLESHLLTYTRTSNVHIIVHRCLGLVPREFRKCWWTSIVRMVAQYTLGRQIKSGSLQYKVGLQSHTHTCRMGGIHSVLPWTYYASYILRVFT